MSIRDIFQTISLFAALCGLSVWLLYVWRNRHNGWAYAVPALLFLGHVAIYYTCTLLIPPTPGVTIYGTWSSGIRLQAVLSVLGIGVTLLSQNRERKQ